MNWKIFSAHFANLQVVALEKSNLSWRSSARKKIYVFFTFDVANYNDSDNLMQAELSHSAQKKDSRVTDAKLY